MQYSPHRMQLQTMEIARLQQRQLVVSDGATPFGCCNFFDRCTDELLSLHFAGMLPLLDYMGFNVSDVCHKVIEFITYVRPESGGR